MTDHSRDIEKYLKGELTSAERHALEKKALSDPFLADALEGAEQLIPADFTADVTHLDRKIAARKTVSGWTWTLRIAAGLAFIVVATIIVWNLSDTTSTQELALTKDKKEDTPAKTDDTITSTPDAVSVPPAVQPAAGPTHKDAPPPKEHPAAPTKTDAKPLVAETKPQDKAGDVQVNNEPVAAVDVRKEAEEKVEVKVEESVAQNQAASRAAESSRYKAADDRYQGLSKKSFAKADKDAAAPSAIDQKARAAGFEATGKIITGQITSAEDGSPLPGVNVVIKNTTIGTATDAEGNYQLKLDSSNQTLVYSFIGLQTTEEKVKDRQQVNVAMSTDATQLSEVVTTGYGSQTTGERVPPVVDLAHPEIGNRLFKQYLEKNIRYPEQARRTGTEGRVTVEFTIEANGTLTNFTVIRGIGAGCDEELIRLIKEGPKWVPTKKDDVPVQDKAKVRLKFELPK